MFPKHADLPANVVVNARGLEALGATPAPENRGTDSRLQTVGGVRRRTDLGGGAARRVDGRGVTKLRQRGSGVKVNPTARLLGGNQSGTNGVTGGNINVRGGGGISGTGTDAITGRPL